MADITVSTTLLEKAATFAQQATPILEKTASEKAAFEQVAPGLVDSMINAGVLQAKSRDAAIKNLVDGGLSKCAELIPFLAGKIQAPSMGGPAAGNGIVKKAGYAQPKSSEKLSDQVWREGMLA